MKWISWNVNGLRACINKGFFEFVRSEEPDFLALQEIKMKPEQADFSIDGYHIIWNSAQKSGYSGTAVFTKRVPDDIRFEIGFPELDAEGRVITLYYSDFIFVNVYTPNAQDGLRRLDTRMRWDDRFREYLNSLPHGIPVIVCGDMNVAHQEIDLKNPKSNRQNPGFTDEERGQFTNLLNAGFVDTFRHFYPDQTDIYSWWSYRFQARQKNIGWRIDYFVVSDDLKPRLKDAKIHTEIFGSDHCPVELTLE